MIYKYNINMKILILGAGGFIGGHLGRYLKSKGMYVVGVDQKHHEYFGTEGEGEGERVDMCDEFIVGDLRDREFVDRVLVEDIDELYQLAADMGGSTYINTGEHDADVVTNSCVININVLKRCAVVKPKRIFYASSACVYPEYNQEDRLNPDCTESSVYPANPDSEYGWEKLFSERMYLTFARNYGLDVRIARFHNIFGPYGVYSGGREKAPAAICRKVIEAKDGSEIEIYGDGLQTRSFLYIDQCLEGVRRLMDSETFQGPVNIGSDHLISINDLAKMVIKISGKDLKIVNVPFNGVGVRGRNSDNRLIKEQLGWVPETCLENELTKTYNWIRGSRDNCDPSPPPCSRGIYEIR